jgi:YHS domain-containing protein
MAVDPVCKMEVDEKAPAGGKVHYWDKVFYFCSENCRKAFRREPQKYTEISEEKTPGSTYKKRPDDWFA